MLTLETYENQWTFSQIVILANNAAMATNATNTSRAVKPPKSKIKSGPAGIKRDRVNVWITRKCADDLALLMAQLVINQRAATQMAVLEALVAGELQHQKDYAQQVAQALIKAASRAKYESQ